MQFPQKPHFASIGVVHDNPLFLGRDVTIDAAYWSGPVKQVSERSVFLVHFPILDPGNSYIFTRCTYSPVFLPNLQKVQNTRNSFVKVFFSAVKS
jgi:hypothetical protein